MQDETTTTIVNYTFAHRRWLSSSVTTNTESNETLLSGVSSPSILSNSQTPNDPLYSQQGYLTTTNVPHAWQTTTGSSSQGIAVVSMGGVNDNHEDLNTRVTIQMAGPGVGAANPAAGIIGAATNNGKGIAGVNWSAPVSSYNIAKQTTKTVTRLDDGHG